MATVRGATAGADVAREVLALFGAVDHAVGESDSEHVASTVDRFLPRYSTNAGWYGELEKFLFQDDARETPDLEATLQRIAEADEADVRLRQPQKARLLYVLSTLANLPDCCLPSITTGGTRDLAVNALAAAGPTSAERNTRLDIANARFDDFLTRNPKSVQSWSLQDGLIGAETAEAPLCSPSLVTINGLEAIRIDTETRSATVSLNNLKNVVNPYNWKANYPEFFLEMSEPPKPIASVFPDKWRRVLERVRFFERFELLTPLKFYPWNEKQDMASIDYDLDSSQLALGDRKVHVDRGYINMYVDNPTNDPAARGVRVKTCKIVRIDGISPFAQERLVCITGYGTASADFLFGRAEDPPAEAEHFDYPVDDAEADAADLDDTPIGPARHAVPAASQMWIDTLQELTNEYADFAEKWSAGSLTMSDISDRCNRVGGKLASAPINFLDAISRSRYRTR